MVVTQVERPLSACPHSVGQQCQGLDLLGSIDPLKGQCPCPLEAPPNLGPAFMLHLVGKEPCQGKGLHLGYNQDTHESSVSY